MGAWRPAASEVQLDSATLAVRDRLLLRTRWGGRLSVASNAYAFTDANHPAPLSTRDLGKWFEHYQKAKRSVRERMLDHPRLFLQALRNVPKRRRASACVSALRANAKPTGGASTS